MSHREKAEILIASIARLQHMQFSGLSESGTVGYGSLQFGHRANDEFFHVAVLISHNPLWNQIDDEATEAHKRFMRALNDPRYGGMFDTAEASWAFDEATGRLLLFRNFSVDSSPGPISEYVDHLLDVAAMWIAHWKNALSHIVFHNAPLPSRRVTLDDNPYSNS